jgi:enamine deaminase RidA (YjgF/YER057c/UK114 family)
MPNAFPSAESRLEELGIVLPAPPAPPGNYVSAYAHERLVETAGHLPLRDGVPVVLGTLGDGLTVTEGLVAARVATLNALSSLRARVGSLDRVERVVKLRGYVAATTAFGEHHLVTNGASDLILSIFGPEAGAHVRASVGVASLPFGAPIEIELSAILRPDGAPSHDEGSTT